MSLIRITGTEVSFEQSDSHRCILSAGLQGGVGLPHECHSGGCGSCKFELLEGKVEELWPEAPGLSARDIQKGRKLACQCRATTDLVIKVRIEDRFRPLIPTRHVRARLESRRRITGDITEFRFTAPGAANFLAGQFAMLRVPGFTQWRAYSMSNLANTAGSWHFWIRRKSGGKITEHLFAALGEGEEIELEGPFGLSYLRTSENRDVLCIAGGSGLSPMLSIARAVLGEPAMADRKLEFFFGGRTPADICGLEELAQLPGFAERARFHAAISEPKPGDGWLGEIGFIHETVRRKLAGSLARYQCYLAGPPPMIHATAQMLMLDQGVPPEQILFDRFY
jgi:toluene monooxygenase electron transfer component